MAALQKKICLLGDFCVGKTSLMRRFVEGIFDDKYISTIGVKISRKIVTNADKQVNLLIWDMTGGEDIGSPTRVSYLRGAAGALMVCDLTRRSTLAAFERYSKQMRQINPQTTLVFIGNKVDLVHERMISDGELQEICSRLGNSTFILTSAKTGYQVEEAFNYLVELLDPNWR